MSGLECMALVLCAGRGQP